MKRRVQELLLDILIVALTIITLLVMFAISGPDAHAQGLRGIRDGVLTAEYIPEPEVRYDLSAEDEELLCRIAYAEAGNQGLRGMGLIMECVMARVADPHFPDNVHDVIFQPHQFSTSHWFYEAPIDEITPALEMVQSGEVDGGGALFFCTASFRSGTFLYSYGGHNFFTF